MDCSEARLLIRKNMIAGAGPGRVPRLGFHLSECPGCRNYYHAHRARKGHHVSSQTIGTMHQSSRSSTTRRGEQRVRRTLMVAVTGLILVGFWLVGLPLARAVDDILVMTSLEQASADFGSVGHLSSPPSILVAVTPEPTTMVPTVQLSAEPPLATSIPSTPTASPLVTRRDITPTNAPMGDQPDRWTTRDRFRSPSITITPSRTASSLISSAKTATPVLSSDEAANDNQNAKAAAGSTTILFLGLDAREGEGFIARSDAILVAHLDPEQNRLSMLSLPRDLWVTIPGAGEGKINSAFVIGEQVGEGASLAKETVGDAIGVTIDYVVVMDFTGFRSLVDALDGINIDVPTELYDPNFPTEDYGYTIAHFLPGVQTMDGDRALTYSRIRHPDSDFQRMRRQEAVVLAIARKIRTRGMLRNLSEADQLTSALRPYMRTDMSPTMALNLLWSMRSVDLSSAHYIAADGSMLTETNIGGAYVIYADVSVLHFLGAQLIEGVDEQSGHIDTGVP